MNSHLVDGSGEQVKWRAERGGRKRGEGANREQRMTVRRGSKKNEKRSDKNCK